MENKQQIIQFNFNFFNNILKNVNVKILYQKKLFI